MAILPYKPPTVTVPAASKDMTTLATVKLELGVTVTTYDTLFAGFIQQCSAAIVAFCGREFAKETLVDSFRVNRSDTTLQLSRRPIVSVTSVVEDDVTLTAPDYEIDTATGWLIRLDADGDPMGWGYGKVVVTYIAGWTMLTELPSDLEQTAIDLIKSRWFARMRDPMVRGEEVPGVLRTEYWVATGIEIRGLPAGIAARLEELGYVEVTV